VARERRVTQKDLDQQLHDEAARLGVSLYGTFDGSITNTAELQQRVWQAKREKRDARLWWIAVLSCVASVLSALAAWYAVVHSGR